MNFFELGARERVGEANVWMKLDRMIDWEKIRERLKGFHRKEEEDRGGQRPYDVLKMFKAIVLGQWHSLSDPELEHSLRVRVDFILFCGFEMNEAVPDETTLCRFRNQLIRLGLLEELLGVVNGQLERDGLKVQKSRGAVVDATVIESAARPRKTVEVEVAVDRQEEEIQASSLPIVEESKDPDARWLKKGKKCFFGYKGFIRTDVEDGYIEAVKVTPAHEAEVNKLEDLIGENQGRRVYADKAYSSKANRQILKKAKMRDAVMHKAVRGTPLSLRQKMRNKLISGHRFIIEQAFGTLKRKFRMARASYFTTQKVAAQMFLKAICFNLLKASNKILCST